MPNLHEKLKQRWPESITEIHAHRGDETAIVKRESFLDIARFIKKDPEFDMNILMDQTAVDGLGMNWRPRYEVVYHFYSLKKNHRLRIKVKIDERDMMMPSAVNLWPIANWFEREVWDMFGIRFDGHPNLKRILLYEEFVGHPLRKDYPINKRQPLIGPGSKEDKEKNKSAEAKKVQEKIQYGANVQD
jgi:NADH-quinone oxidoreductase subunit C